MATLPTRIRRISLDAGEPENYTLAATSAYDATDPAATTATWGDGDADVVAMDQALTIPTPPALTVAAEGALIEFQRTPSYFLGCIAKVAVTYDLESGERPVLELWTRDATSDVWTKRRGIGLATSVGAPTGRVKQFDLRLAVPVRNVDAVWVTMNPGDTGSPSMTWLGIHCFGFCQVVPRYDGNCRNDPTLDCIDPNPCLDTPEACLDPALDCEDIDPTGELCTEPPFEWPTPTPADGGPTPEFEPPAFPIINLCNPAAVEAYKALLTPEQLTYFEDLLSTSEFPCLNPEDRSPDPVAPINEDPDNPGEPLLPAQPIETYINPQTLEPEADPQGGTTGTGGQPPEYATTVNLPVFAFFDEGDIALFEDTLTSEPSEVQEAWENPRKQIIIFGNGVEPIDDVEYVQSCLDAVTFQLAGVGTGDIVEVTALTAITDAQGVTVSPFGVFIEFPVQIFPKASISSSQIVGFLVERGSRLLAIPDSTPEEGGTGVATTAQRSGIVRSGSGAVTITVKTALDPSAQTGGSVTASDETVHTIGGPQNAVTHKHHGANDSSDPPFERSTGVLFRRYYFKVAVTKKTGSFNADPNDGPTGFASVYTVVEHTSVADAH